MGARVALIEKHKMGGDCLNTGCVPSKAILRAAKLAYDARRSQDFGLDLSLSPINMEKVMASVREVQAKIAPHDSVERFEGLGAEVHLGSFHFISHQEISDGEQILKAKRFVVATGSSPAVPSFKGIENFPYRSSENIWDLTQLPGRLVILGGGPIGVELAQAFRRLGSEVALVQRRDRLLAREDPEVSKLIQEIFSKEGIKVYLGYKPKEIRKNSNHTELILENPQKGETVLHLDELLVATGRRPNVAGLHLEKAGVQSGKQGVEVDSYLRTTAKHIYACGDVTGPYLFTHTAAHQARTILRNALFPGKSKINYRVIPWSTFCDPEVARVGLNESEALKKNIPHQVFRYSLSQLDRALCDREAEGFIKVLTPPGSDKILGVTLVASHGGDLLAEWVLAMQQGVGLKTLANLIHIYPTLAEVTQRLGGVFQSSRLTPRTKRWLERYFRWRFG